MDNINVTAPSAKIREVARTVMSGYGKALFLTILVYYLLNGGVSVVLDEFFFYTVELPIEGLMTVPYKLGYGSQIYSMLVGGAFEFGLCMFLITFFRKKTVDMTLIFEGFSHFLKTLGLMLIMTIKIALWSMLFIIPGIIASFRYSQAFYIMVDHPEYSISQCISESSRMMRGNKFKLFCLQFSFIGWYLLASLPMALIGNMFINSGRFTYIIVTLLLSLPAIFVDAYALVSATAFYELAAGNLVIREFNEYEAYEQEKRMHETDREEQSTEKDAEIEDRICEDKNCEAAECEGKDCGDCGSNDDDGQNQDI